MTCAYLAVDDFYSCIVTVSVAETDDLLTGAVKSKAVSCPMVLKNWSSDQSDVCVRQSSSSEAGKNDHLFDSFGLNGVKLQAYCYDSH